ncbi:MAG TPA: hypothetical protein VMO17_18325 [Terriglobia bacterium]|nr:hypothetical protein [Terriglobia bacterium]
MKYVAPGLLICVLLIPRLAIPRGLDPPTREGFSATPLTDLGTRTYKGFEGGLYPHGSNSVPVDHAAAGLKLAREVQPLDATGKPDPKGKIVITSIGMSNSMDEFGMFLRIARGSPKVDRDHVSVVNGAFGGITACYYLSASGSPPCSQHTGNVFNRIRDERLTPAGVSEQQVQVVWILQANGGPGVRGCGRNRFEACRPLCNPKTPGCINDPLETEALRHEAQLGETLRVAKVRWPNLKLAFLSSRIYAGYAKVPISPEPFAFEYGFSAKWIIQAQISQVKANTVDPVAGNLDYRTGIVPWVAWGPYLWADGTTPRSDGLAWCNGEQMEPCHGETDFQADGTHPNVRGMKKVADSLMEFFLQSPFTSPWFDAAGRTKGTSKGHRESE